MKRARHRYPVRDPLAGILSDWFGIEAGSAKALVSLYHATGPLHRDTLASRAGVAPSGIAAIGARLRAAGVDIPKGHGARNAAPLYELTVTGRAQVKEAFDHTSRLLHSEAAERIEALEIALGMRDVPPDRTPLAPREAELYGMLKRNRTLSRDRAYQALYGHLDDAPSPKVLDVMMHRIRRKMAPHSIVAYRGGWTLEEAA